MNSLKNKYIWSMLIWISLYFELKKGKVTRIKVFEGVTCFMIGIFLSSDMYPMKEARIPPIHALWCWRTGRAGLLWAHCYWLGFFGKNEQVSPILKSIFSFIWGKIV